MCRGVIGPLWNGHVYGMGHKMNLIGIGVFLTMLLLDITNHCQIIYLLMLHCMQ